MPWPAHLLTGLERPLHPIAPWNPGKSRTLHMCWITQGALSHQFPHRCDVLSSSSLHNRTRLLLNLHCLYCVALHQGSATFFSKRARHLAMRSSYHCQTSGCWVSGSLSLNVPHTGQKTAEPPVQAYRVSVPCSKAGTSQGRHSHLPRLLAKGLCKPGQLIPMSSTQQTGQEVLPSKVSSTWAGSPWCVGHKLPTPTLLAFCHPLKFLLPAHEFYDSAPHQVVKHLSQK